MLFDSLGKSAMKSVRVKIRQTICSKAWRQFLALPVVLLTACGSPEQRSQGYYENGIALIQKKDDVGARLELLNAVKYKGDKIEAWRALAAIDERAKAAQNLFQDLRRIVELDPSDLEARIKLGKMLLAGGAPDAALRLVEGADAAGSQNAGLHALKAAILLRTRDANGAYQEAAKAIEIDPGDVEAAIVQASEKLSKGDSDGALQLLSKSPIASKNDVRIDQLRVQILAQKGDLGEAETILHKLIEQRPQESILRGQLVQIYLAQRRFEDAEKELRALATANPANSATELDLVRLIAAVRGVPAAREELVSRIKAGGDVFPYQMALADFDFNQGKFDDSVALLGTLIKGSTSAEHMLAAQAKLAEFYFRKANYPAAETLVSDILKKDSHNTTGLKIRASIRIEQRQFESAIADLREALNSQPKASDLLLLMALAYEMDGKLELADRQYADAAKSAARNANITLQYVRFLQRQGRIAQADDVVTEAVGVNPRSIELLEGLAQIRLARQNWTGALAAADSISRIGNDRGIADQIRGAAFAGQNKLEQSIAALEIAHAAAPERVQPVMSLVTGYIRAKKIDKAEALLNDMIKKYPDNAQLSLLMGNTQLAQNNNDRAADYFKTAISQAPKNPAGYLALSNLDASRMNYDEAARILLQDGLREQPNELSLKLALGNVLILKKDYEGAIALYEGIIKDQPNTLVAVNNLANLLLDYRPDQASLDQAYALTEKLKDSNLPQFQDTVGWAQSRRKQYQSAAEILEAALGKLPDSAAIRYHLGMTYKGLGMTDKALEQLNAALRLEPDGSALKDNIRSALK
jgi:cellulose synthase operon protein C